MLKAVEKVVGHLSDHETPSAEYVALKVEECENGECTAASLDEVSSKADRNTSALQTSLDSNGPCEDHQNKIQRPASRKHRRIPEVDEAGGHNMAVYVFKIQVKAFFGRFEDGGLSIA